MRLYSHRSDNVSISHSRKGYDMDGDKLAVIINSELQKNNSMSVKKILKNIGVAKDRATRLLNDAGYTFDYELKQYVKDNGDSSGQMVTDKEIQQVEIISQTTSATVTELKMMEQYKGLFSKYDVLMEMIHQYEVTRSANVTNGLVIELPHEVKSDTRVTFRVNDTVYKEFKKFLEHHKQFTVKEIISQAMLDMINKYK